MCNLILGSRRADATANNGDGVLLAGLTCSISFVVAFPLVLRQNQVPLCLAGDHY